MTPLTQHSRSCVRNTPACLLFLQHEGSSSLQTFIAAQQPAGARVSRQFTSRPPAWLFGDMPVVLTMSSTQISGLCNTS